MLVRSSRSSCNKAEAGAARLQATGYPNNIRQRCTCRPPDLRLSAQQTTILGEIPMILTELQDDGVLLVKLNRAPVGFASSAVPAT